PIQLEQSIVAYNTAAGSPANCMNLAGPFSPNADHYSIESANTCGLHTDASHLSLINTDPLLAPLGANGGQTRTLGLYDQGPAGDGLPRHPSGSCSQAEGVDQRDVARPAAPAGLCDVGAFEGTVGPAPSNPGNGGSSTTTTPTTTPQVCSVSTKVAVTA